MMSLTLRKLVVTALTLLVAGHLLAAHVGHLLKHENHDGSNASHLSFQTHPHYDMPVDLDNWVLLASESCPIPTVLGQRIGLELDLAIGCQAVEPLLSTPALVPIEPPATDDAPRPPGPDRQAILQRFTL